VSGATLRLAAFGDIHGNPIALDAVLADIEAAGGVDGYLVLGDVAALGYDPAGAVERITGLPHAVFVRGNTDRYTVSGNLPDMTAENRAEVITTFAWTRGFLTAAGWFDWLASLPLDSRLMLPDGTRLLVVHASPGLDDGPGVAPKHSDEELGERMAGAEADLVLVGHTHQAVDRVVGDVRVVNPGSVGMPIAPTRSAGYALIEANRSGYRVDLRRVDYDHGAVIDAIDGAHHPTPDFLLRYYRR
jgi:predicted phosphodiesterase